MQLERLIVFPPLSLKIQLLLYQHSSLSNIQHSTHSPIFLNMRQHRKKASCFRTWQICKEVEEKGGLA